MAVLLVILPLLIILIFLLFIRHYQIRKKDPPGPFSLPLVGQLPLLILSKMFSRSSGNMNLEKYFREMGQKYGDIWSMDMGNYRIITFVSMDVLTEAYIDNGKIFTGVPSHETFKIISEGRGIGFVDENISHDNRQLAIKALRDLGMGKQLLENKICDEGDHLIEHILKNSSAPIASPGIFTKSVSNVINQLVFSERIKYNDPEFEDLMANMKIMMHSNTAHEILQLVTKVLPSKYSRKIFPAVDQFMKSCAECIKYIGKKCRSRIKIEGEFSKPNCVFDYFWRYRYQNEPEIDEKEKFLDISHSMFDLFLAGTDTISNLLGFCFLMLGKYPDVQDDLRNEIQLLVDDYKLITMDMKKNCPKLLSFIDEVHRYCNLIVLVQHRAIETFVFRGYKIRPNDIICNDFSSFKRDPTIFDHPEDFDPYRFMDESRTKYVPNKSLISFGIGKRACLGESIAVMELFIFISKIIQRFKICFPMETQSKLSDILEGTYGIIHVPMDHKIIFQPL